MDAITWVWAIVIVVVVGFIIYYLVQPSEGKKEESKKGETDKSKQPQNDKTTPPSQGGTPNT